ncbi:MAG: YihY/virulence factor BrkB family protein [Actinomycetes bacterium]
MIAYREQVRAGSRLAPVGRVAGRTLDGMINHRISGLAAEAAFFALLSLPPLVLAVVGTIGYFHGLIGTDNITSLQNDIARGARTVLRPSTVNDTVMPIVRNVLNGGRAEAVSIGFLISLWSGSRAMSTYMDAITIAYDLEGRRSWLTKRVLAYGLYAGAVLVGIVVLPLLVIGPKLAERAAHHAIGSAASLLVTLAYWPFVVLFSIAALTTLYHLATPVRTPWRRDAPGAVLALLIWLGGSIVLRLYLDATVHEGSAYGSLAAPVAVLLWLYVTALAVLIGAEFNSALMHASPARGKPRPDFLGRPQRVVERRLGLRGPDAPDAPEQPELPAPDRIS